MELGLAFSKLTNFVKMTVGLQSPREGGGRTRARVRFTTARPRHARGDAHLPASTRSGGRGSFLRLGNVRKPNARQIGRKSLG